MQECLDALLGAKWFSTLECTSGFFQVKNHPDDMDKSAFICNKGLYAFKVLPMGLVNSPATYQRLMNHIMSPLRLASFTLTTVSSIRKLSRSISSALTGF